MKGEVAQGMKILILNYEYPPLGAGAAPVCRDLAVGMGKQRHQVTVVTMGFKGLPEYEVQDGVEIFRMKCLRLHEHSCSPLEQLSYIHNTERFLQTYLKTHHYDVCHTHFIVPTGPIALWIKKNYGIPYVLTAHGSDVEGHNRKLSVRSMHRALRPAWRKIVREAYAAAAPSEHLMRLMKRVYPGRRYLLIPNGLDIKKYASAGKQKEKRILIMGRMQEFKNVQTILKAIARIPGEQWGEWHTDILGEGPFRKELEQMARKLGIGTRVSFRGWVDNGTPEQISYLKKAAVYITASRFENCPMAVLEAAAAGCCLLMSDIEGHRQFFKNGPDSFFFQPEDAEELAEKLENLLALDLEEIVPEEVDISVYDNERVTGKYVKLLEKAARDFHRKISV